MPNQLSTFAAQQRASGQSLQNISKGLAEQFPEASTVELARELHRLMASSRPMSASREPMLRRKTVTKSDPLVSDAAYLASLLISARPGSTPSEIAVALKDPQVYPNLTALQMGQVLKDPQVFPQITAQDMAQALLAAGYSQGDTDAAVAQIYPSPPKYRRLGPVGPTYNVFDDTQAAQNLNQPITQIVVRAGDIIDQVRAFYGPNKTPLPQHGGNGGQSHEIVLDSGDFLTSVSGFYGQWFGRPYILQITLKTRNGKTHGPFGSMQYSSSPAPFTFQAEANEQVLAFFGSTVPGLEADGTYSDYMTSLGVTVKTN